MGFAVSGCQCGAKNGVPPAITSPSIASALATNFRLFRSPPEPLPRSLGIHLAEILNQSTSRLIPLEAQKARTPDGSIWAFSERGSVCLAQAGRGAVACTSPSQAIAHGISLGVFDPPDENAAKPHNFLLLGLAPDAVDRAELAIGRDHRSVVINNNVYSISAERPITIKHLARDAH